MGSGEGASLLAQSVKNLPALQETQIQSLGREDPLGEGNSYSLQYSCLENLMDRRAWWVQSMGLQELDYKEIKPVNPKKKKKKKSTLNTHWKH